jgi:hypothetical protein
MEAPTMFLVIGSAATLMAVGSLIVVGEDMIVFLLRQKVRWRRRWRRD